MDFGFDIGFRDFEDFGGLSNRNCRCLRRNGFGIHGCVIGRCLKNCFGIGCSVGRFHSREIVPLSFLEMRARTRERKKKFVRNK